MIPHEARYLVGLIGAEIGTSLSPQLHEREADELGLRYFYQLIDIERLGLAAEEAGPLLSEAHRMGFRGLNITHPCKQIVVPHLNALSPAAAALGAVNTVEFADGKMIGHNTDSSGFETAFTRELPSVPLRHVVILGAGGAGPRSPRPAAAGRALTIAELVPSRAERLTAALRTQFAPDWVRPVHPGHPRPRAAAGAGATPVGWSRRRACPCPRTCCGLRSGRGRRLPSAGDRTAPACPCARLPHPVGQRHGGLSGRCRLPPIHRVRTRHRADARSSGVLDRGR